MHTPVGEFTEWPVTRIIVLPKSVLGHAIFCCEILSAGTKYCCKILSYPANYCPRTIFGNARSYEILSVGQFLAAFVLANFYPRTIFGWDNN